MFIYKVVTKDLRSAIVGNSYLAIQYKIGEWIEAPVGGILCFNNLKAAKGFARFNRNRLFRVKTKGKLNLPPKAISSYQLDSKKKESVEKYWKTHDNMFPEEQALWPVDTVAYKKIMLVKEIL